MRRLAGMGLLAVLVAAAPASAAPRLRAFDSCAALVRYASAHAGAARPLPGPVAGPVAPTAQDAPGAERAGDDVSTTNVQEAGIDEPDVVKVDGGRLLAISDGVLYAIDARAATPRIAGSLALPPGAGHELLVRDGRALVIAAGAGGDRPVPLPRPVDRPGAVAPEILPWTPTTILAELDVRDPAAMRVVRTETVDGRAVGARLRGATARVAIASPLSVAADPAARERLVGCRQVRRPARFAGSGLLTVLTIDLERGLPAVDADAVAADADTVYASARALYVATHRWDPGATATRTEIHRFDATAGDATRYDASGAVEGSLLSQFALSEHDGALRVASTRERDAIVTVLAPRDGRLAELGRVEGLGPDERIRGVRFLGDVGYVVTFRQTDPLYTVDLSDPARPRVAGELKILGYSAYLHPVGDGRLLGIGQDATPEGRTLGAQASLFDVSDPAAPRRLDQRRLGDGAWTPVEGDHHAFLWWPAARLAVLPVGDRGASSALGLRVGASALAEAGRVAAPQGASFARATVVGERLFLLAPGAGVQVAALGSLAPGAWLALTPPSG